MRRISRVFAGVGLVGALVMLTSCRVDVTTSVRLDRTGAGEVTVDVIADAAVMERVPDLASQLRLDDLTESGWQTDGPTPTDDGGLRVTLVHPVNGPDEANQVLEELNGPRGPYRDLRVERAVDETSITMSLTGSLGTEGIAALADAAMQELLPDVPLSSLLTAPDGSPIAIGDVFGARLVVGLPGPDGDDTPVTFDDEGATEAQVFTMPTDGSALDVAVQSVVTVEPGRRAPVVAVIAGVALVVWLGVAGAFAVYVLRQHRTRTR